MFTGGQLKSSHLSQVKDFYKASGCTALGGSSQLHSMDVRPDAGRWHGDNEASRYRPVAS